MCGVVGLIRYAPGGADALRTVLGSMSEVLRHRGPDDAGTWTDPDGSVGLGFRRLSILDLSSAGHQPMLSESGRWVMVFNGEIYNFASLRSELDQEGASFRGDSDSEVLLAAIDRWGVDRTLPRLIGMFAIALVDREENRLLLVRDRMGIKPLYYARLNGGLAFSSELGALMQAPGFDRSLDLDALGLYLRYLYIPAPKTPFASAWKLPPGHLLTIPLSAPLERLPAPRPFWTLGTGGDPDIGQLAPGDAVSALDDLLRDSVRLRMVSDVPLGALLSGGIDSSVVVALMQAQSTRPVRTFSIGFDRSEHDESAHARAVADHLGTDHTELILSQQDAVDVVPSIPEIFDEPLADPSQIPTYLVCRLARRDVTVALTGDGGDELFAGYNRHISGLPLMRRLRRTPAPARSALAFGLGAVSPRLLGRIYAAAGRGELRLAETKARKLGRLLRAGSSPEMYQILLSTLPDPHRFISSGSGGSDPVLEGLSAKGRALKLGDLLLTDQRYYLPDDLLQKVDRASMAVSLEARVPLLDHRVVEFSWGLPADLKIREGRGKWILRQVLARYVPEQLTERPKTGFSAPIESWLRGALRPWAEEQLLSGSAVREPLLDAGAVERAWTGFLAGDDRDAYGLWAMAVLEAWRDRWQVNDLHAKPARAGEPAAEPVPGPTV